MMPFAIVKILLPLSAITISFETIAKKVESFVGKLSRARIFNACSQARAIF
jgi:hypothetical protein